nr:MAG TPA: hypothetical protein [Herelleviridae sp.]
MPIYLRSKICKVSYQFVLILISSLTVSIISVIKIRI